MPATVLGPPHDDDTVLPILSLDAFPSTGEPKHDKPSGWAFFSSLGSPKYVVAPMVDQSELAWRVLSRRHGAELVYTPMINSNRFLSSTMGSKKASLQSSDYWIADDASLQEEGAQTVLERDTDAPVIVQFAANDPDVLLKAAQVVERHCHAVDLNLGCPQHIARRGHYGSFLQSDWQLIFQLINKLHINLRVPVTAKMRVFDSVERTVAYAQMLERAGAQMIAVHGRTREMKGHKSGLADWMKIKAVKEAVSVPVLANGNVLYHEDVDRALSLTGADGVMSAEGNLYNPAIFATPPSDATALYPHAPALPFPSIVLLAYEYLDICAQLHTPTGSNAIRGHLFRLARPALEVHRDLRPVLGQSRFDMKAAPGKERIRSFYDFVDRLAALLDADRRDVAYTIRVNEAMQRGAQRKWQAPSTIQDADPEYIPHWLAQPYYRKTMPPQNEGADETEARREKRKMRVQETTKTAEKAEAGLTPITDVQTDGEVEALRRQSEVGGGESHAKRLRDTIEQAQSHKTAANALFGKSLYDQAILQYTEALDCLPPRPKSVDEEEDGGEVSVEGKNVDDVTPAEDDQDMRDISALRAVIYANLAACHAKLDQHKETVVACNESLLDDPNYVKALHRRAQANEHLDTWSSLTSALEDYKKIQSLPHPASLDVALRTAVHQRLPARITEQSAREKDEMMGKLKGIGDSVLGWFGLSTDNFQVQKGQDGGMSLNFVNGGGAKK